MPCSCGKAVEVPSLMQLKQSIGQPTKSADSEIRSRLDDGSLPLESRCAVCDAATAHMACVYVECERRDVKDSVPLWQKLPVTVLGWVLGTILIWCTDYDTQLVGRDVSFHLPVRVCEYCVTRVRTVKAARQALLRSELYARLLEKYPHARVSPPN